MQNNALRGAPPSATGVGDGKLAGGGDAGGDADRIRGGATGGGMDTTGAATGIGEGVRDTCTGRSLPSPSLSEMLPLPSSCPLKNNHVMNCSVGQ